MMSDRRLGALLLVAALSVMVPDGWAGEDANAVEGSSGQLGVTAPSTPVAPALAVRAEGFSLGLEEFIFGEPESFGLFSALSSADASRRDRVPLGTWTDPSTSPMTSGLDDLSAELVWRGDRVPDGLSFDLSVRTWDDLDGWEKTGLVMSRASAAAGLGYLLYQLLD